MSTTLDQHMLAASSSKFALTSVSVGDGLQQQLFRNKTLNDRLPREKSLSGQGEFQSLLDS